MFHAEDKCVPSLPCVVSLDIEGQLGGYITDTPMSRSWQFKSKQMICSTLPCKAVFSRVPSNRPYFPMCPATRLCISSALGVYAWCNAPVTVFCGRPNCFSMLLYLSPDCCRASVIRGVSIFIRPLFLQQFLLGRYHQPIVTTSLSRIQLSHLLPFPLLILPRCFHFPCQIPTFGF